VYTHSLRVKEAGELFTERGLCRTGLEDLGEAEADFRHATVAEPKYAQAHFYLASRIAAAGKWRDAALEFETYLKLDPNGSLADSAKARLKRVREMKTAQKN
jgi:lipoprotein NlpI